jgi:hypothetical protein
MNRRNFLKSAALAAAATTATAMETTTGLQIPEETPDKSDKPLIDSAPMLQNYAETSMGIAFSVSKLANGFVDYSENADMSG